MLVTSRRTFLKGLSLATLAVGASRSLLLAAAQDSSLAISGEDGMIVRSYRFVDLESPAEYFNRWLIAVPHFFVRNHMLQQRLPKAA